MIRDVLNMWHKSKGNKLRLLGENGRQNEGEKVDRLIQRDIGSGGER